ncbi:unnamed protein product [Notodromas monacha]|uniref:Large ribosomal subunit protein mL53 n=1 Tax=Notodromas monacha TaxID=399045 RepID=A0A7R9GGC2_9CRUS|nr:unnamed protein product [Notodromas monacha]CAG0920229.1 unnamed protein product [Notodromas monacha]
MAEKFKVARMFGKVVNKVKPIVFEGAWVPKPTSYALSELEAKKLNLKPVKKITVRFDPFEASSTNARWFLYLTSDVLLRETNLKCSFKVDVVNDRLPSQIGVELENGQKLKILPANLTPLEIMKEINSVVLPLVPPPLEESKIVQTKATKKQKR